MLEKIPIKTSSDPRNKIIINNNFYKNVKIKTALNINETFSPETTCFPSDETLSQFALAVYRDNPDKVLEGWTLLTTATNESDGYFGAAFWNFKFQQLVIAHRGTQPSNLKSLVADIEGVIRNQFTPQMNSASTFVAHLLKQLPAAEKMRISMTGHSLGAWLAQVTAFTAEYLTIKDKKFCLKNEGDFKVHAHTLGFESPGCRPMLTKLAENFHFRYRTHAERLLRKLDITNYLTLPNRINCCNKHVGDLRQIVIEKPENESLNFYKYLLHYHSMENIVDAMRSSGNFGNEVGVMKGGRLKINDWPCTFWPERAVNSLKLPIGFINNLYNGVLLALDAATNTNTLELSAYNRGLDDESDGDFTYGITEHYNVVKIDAFKRNANIFTEVEFTFLSNWMKIKEQKIQFSVENPRVNLKKFMDSLPEYSIDEDEENIRCNSEAEVKKVVKLTKLFFTSLALSEAREINKKLAEKLETGFEICRKESENFVKEIDKNGLQFADSIDGLKSFLEQSKSEKIFVLKCAEQSVLEMSRVLSILNTLELKNFMFFNWEQIVRLSNLIYLENTFNSKIDHLIVLDCQNCFKEMNENEEIILKSLIEKLKCKLILVVNSQSQIILNSIEAGKIVLVESSFKFSDLLPQSQTLLNLKPIVLNDAKYTLNELIDEESRENLSLKTIEILSKNENVNIGKFNLNSLPTFNISIQLNDPIGNNNNFINSLDNDTDFIVLISSSNVNSSVTDELLEIFDKVSGEKIKRFEAEGKVKICSEKDENRILEQFNNLIKTTTAKSSKIFWLELVSPRLILKQIYQGDLYTPTELRKNTKLNNDVFEFLATDKTSSHLIVFGNYIESPINPKEKDVDKTEFSKYFDLESVECLSKSTQKQFHQKLNETIFCCAENEVETKFNQLVNSYSDECIHWLNLFGKSEVYWYKSHGSHRGLAQYFDDRFVIICDEPGMGKSTSLSKIGEELSSTDSSGWVIHLDLASHQRELQTLTIRTFKDILTLMVTTMDLEPKDLLTKILFCSLKKNQDFHPIVFLFDGFDELNKDAREKMLSILRILKEESLAKIWITTRPDQKKVLEDCLSVVSSKFIKFDTAKQTEYLIKFWKSCLHFHRYEPSLLDNYATEVLNQAENILGVEIPDFLGNPLHMRMVAEVVWPLLKLRITANCEALELIHNFKIHNFFQEFVKIKYESYEKRQNLQHCDSFVRYSVSSTLRKHFRKLALQMLFPYQAQHNFGMESSSSSSVKEDELMVGLMRVGLVHRQSINHQHQFIYRVLAEYFVADFLFYWLKKFRNQHGNYAAATNFVISSMFLEKEHRTIREFMNYTLLIDFETYKDILCID